MGVSKIKNLVIAALVLLNLFFLVIIVSDRTAEAASEKLAAQNACAALAAGGIQISADDIRTGGELRAMRSARDLAAERIIAEAVLGAAELSDEPGVINKYTGQNSGTATFYSGGDFTIYADDGVIKNKSGTLKTVKKLLSSMNLEASELYLSGSPGRETVTVMCAYKNAVIFNCTIRFAFNGDSLETVAGRYVTNIEAVPDGNVLSSPGTALLGFLAAVKHGAIECSRIDGVEAGYQLRETSAFGDGALVPSWLITADTGRYIIDSETGEIRPLPSVYEGT